MTRQPPKREDGTSPAHAGTTGKAGSPAPPSAEQLHRLEEQIARLTDLAARAQADLQNSKARMEREAEEFRAFANVPLLLRLLPIRDDLARAASHNGGEGLRKILEKLDRTLREVGLTPIEALGKHVDPKYHEILNTGPGEKDIVIAIHEEGYELHGKILRPAKVQVGDGTSRDTKPAPKTSPKE